MCAVDAEPCGLCGWTRDTRVNTFVGKIVKASCPYAFTFKLAIAKRKRENVSRECLVPLCSAVPWAINSKCYMARCHPTVALDTIDFSEWYIAVPPAAKNKKEKKKPMSLLHPRITVKVVQAAAACGPSDYTAFSKASGGTCTSSAP